MTEPNFDNRIVPFVQHAPVNQEPNVNASSSTVKDRVNMMLSISLDDFDNRIVPFVQHAPVNQEPSVNMAISISLDDFDQKSAKKKSPVIFRLFAVDIPVVMSEELTSEKPDERKMPNTTNVDQDVLVDLTKEKQAKRKRPNTTNGDRVKRKKRNINNSGEPEPHIPPRIMQEINNIQDQGIMITGPVFFCKKKLEVSDVKEGQNRLFITQKREKKLIEFLTGEEKVELEVGGFDVTAIDAVGKYYSLILMKWQSLDMPVLRKDWSRMIKANDVRACDSVELWGYRQSSKLCLAVNFKKGENAAQSMDAGSSNKISSVTDGSTA